MPSHPSLSALVQQAESLAKTSMSVLLLGETGTGKEKMAQFIHNKSTVDGPMICVDCHSITPSLFEASLFGYEKGAFTDAKEANTGFLRAADGGTLFLDEIGNLSLEHQAKLLRVLETRQFYSLGSTTLQTSSFRLIAATLENLPQRIKDGTFRQDLYYRLAHCVLTLPSLQELPETILEWIDYFIDTFNTEHTTQKNIPFKQKIQWMNQPWPGNLRQLKHTVYHYLSIKTKEKSPVLTLDEKLSWFEKSLIETELKKVGYNTTKASEALGCSRTTLQSKMKVLDIISNKKQLLHTQNWTKNPQKAWTNNLQIPKTTNEFYESVAAGKTALTTLGIDVNSHHYPVLSKEEQWVFIRLCLCFGTAANQVDFEFFKALVLYLGAYTSNHKTCIPELNIMSTAWNSALFSFHTSGKSASISPEERQLFLSHIHPIASYPHFKAVYQAGFITTNYYLSAFGFFFGCIEDLNTEKPLRNIYASLQATAPSIIQSGVYDLRLCCEYLSYLLAHVLKEDLPYLMPLQNCFSHIRNLENPLYRELLLSAAKKIMIK